MGTTTSQGRREPQASAAPPRLQPLRIFIVENNPDTRESLCLLLQQQGHRVGSADSVASALERLPAFGADVLISDIGLDDGTGWELMRRLEASRPPYALAMSGFGSSSDRANSRAAGFRHHLLKPVMPERLDALLVEAGRECGPPQRPQRG